MRKVLSKALPLLAVCALTFGTAQKADAATIGVDIFATHSVTGNGLPFADYVGTLTVEEIEFSNWQPFGLTDFGAHIWGVLHASANGVYQFEMTSNDGASLYIDGALVLDGPGVGTHNLTTAPDGVTMSSNSPWAHEFHIFYFSNGVGEATLDLDLPCYGDYCVVYGDAAVPEPASLLLLGPAALGLVARRRRKKLEA